MDRFNTDNVITKKPVILGDMVKGNDYDNPDKVVYGIYLYTDGVHKFVYTAFQIKVLDNVELVYRAKYNKAVRDKNVSDLEESDIIYLKGKKYKLELLGGVTK